MTAGAPPAPNAQDYDWEGAGRELGTKLDRLHALAVLGGDPRATSLVALGIARWQAKRRRVVLANLLADAEPLRAMAPTDTQVGLADVFDSGEPIITFGRKAEQSGELYVLPMVDPAADQAEMFSNRRWTRVSAAFHKDGGLLVLVAGVSAPEIESLVVQFDGAVLVGDRVQTRLPVARVLGVIRGPQRASRAIRAPIAPPRPQYVIRARRSLWKLGTTVGVSLAAVIAALGIWLASRPMASSEWVPLWLRNRGASQASAGQLLRIEGPAAQPDSGLRLAPSMGLLTKMDSASISPYGIALVSFNTQAGALLELQRHGTSLRAGTFTPVLIRGAPWYRVVAGAYPDSASAAALLDTLRARGTSDAGRAQIEKFPYALLIARGVADSDVATRVSTYQRRGLPVYALLQNDGTARVYAGAFKTPEEATSLYDALRSAGISTSLVYRTGRVY